MSTIKVRLMASVAALIIAASSAIVATAKPVAQSQDSLYMMNKVHKELVTLPYYGVFDNLAYKIDGSTVTLYGQVVRPSTRSSAEKRIKKIEGVERVVNNIEVLPLSTFDDSIRRRAYRAIFRSGGLYRYALGVNPSIHIIVNRGHITLEGVVSNEGDSRLAYIAARGVSGAFSVTNNLRVERKS